MKKKLLIFVLFLLLILLLHCVLARKAFAADLGVWGESSAIMEEDFETHIVKQLKALGEDKLRTHQEQIKDKIVANIKRPRAVKNISKAKSNASRFYDPSFTLREDIYNDKQQLLFPSGTFINPLEKKSFDEIWIFIDGDDEAQVNFAKSYQTEREVENGVKNLNKAEMSNISKTKKIILINGAPGAQQDGSFFFYDQAGAISRKLEISKVPSVVRQAPNKAQILIEEIALDNKQEERGG